MDAEGETSLQEITERASLEGDMCFIAQEDIWEEVLHITVSNGNIEGEIFQKYEYDRGQYESFIGEITSDSTMKIVFDDILNDPLPVYEWRYVYDGTRLAISNYRLRMDIVIFETMDCSELPDRSEYASQEEADEYAWGEYIENTFPEYYVLMPDEDSTSSQEYIKMIEIGDSIFGVWAGTGGGGFSWAHIFAGPLLDDGAYVVTIFDKEDWEEYALNQQVLRIDRATRKITIAHSDRIESTSQFDPVSCREVPTFIIERMEGFNIDPQTHYRFSYPCD